MAKSVYLFIEYLQCGISWRDEGMIFMYNHFWSDDAPPRFLSRQNAHDSAVYLNFRVRMYSLYKAEGLDTENSGNIPRFMVREHAGIFPRFYLQFGLLGTESPISSDRNHPSRPPPPIQKLRTYDTYASSCGMYLFQTAPNPFGTSVPFRGETNQILSNLSPNWDCGRC